LKFPVKGAIWYQGESNAPRAFEYRTLYPTMIKDWRARWNSDLTFIGVQLAPFWDGDSNGVRYAELRDAQLHATNVLKNVGIAVIVDVGNEKDIHPPRKEPVGVRLALNALALAYGKKIEFSGPIFKSLKIEGDKAIVSFDHAEGLASRDESLPGFTIAGEDNVFVPAKAEIKGSSVVVSSDKVRKPAAVRYGWVNFAKPTLSLFNVAGLPASPFRTDDLPLTTAPKK
jgi:sialate O-acetylesterase